MARIPSKHTEELVTPDRMSPSSSSSKPVRTVVSALDPVLPCTQLKPFFPSVPALLRDSPVSLWNSARFTAPGSKPPDARSWPMSARALSIICCRPPFSLPFTSIFLLTAGVSATTSLGAGRGSGGHFAATGNG